MNNLGNLLKIQAIGIFGLKKVKQGDAKQRNKAIGGMVLAAIIIASLLGSSFTYSFAMMEGLKSVQLEKYLFAIMMFASSALILFTTLFRAPTTLFKFSDYDALMSMPIKTGTIVASRIITLYILNFLIAFFIMVPAAVVYAMNVTVTAVYYIVFIILLFMIPIIPMLIGAILGSGVAVAASGFKKQSLLNTLFLLALFLLLFFGMQGLSSKLQDFGSVAPGFVTSISKMYPFSITYMTALCELSVKSIFMILGSSLAIFVMMVVLISTWFKSMHTLLTTEKKGGAYVLKDLDVRSQLVALYNKEVKRFLNTPLYVMNMGIGVLMAVILCIVMAFSGTEKVASILEVPELVDIIGIVIPFALALVVSLSCTTCCSISLEGKSLWVLKSSPVKTSTIFWAKILLNLTLTIPAVLICATMLTFTLQLDAMTTVFLFVTPLAYALFGAVWGLCVNLWFPKLDWTNEVVVIKQSLASMLGLLIGFPLAMLPIVILTTQMLIDATVFTALVTVAMALITAVLTGWMLTGGVKKFNSLS